MKKLVTALFILIMTLVPLYLQRAYYDGLEAKAAIYNRIAVVALPLLFVGLIVHIVKNKIDVMKTIRHMKLNVIDRCVLIFACCVILSCLFSRSFSESFFGTYGWHVGGFVFLSLTVIYFFMTRFLEYDQNMFLPVLITHAIIMVVIIMESANIDVFGFHQGLDESMRYTYLATIGHANWYVGLLCLLMPVYMTFFIESDERVSEIIHLVVCFLGEMNMILCASDGIYLGFGFCLFFILPYILKDGVHLKKAGVLVGGIGASGLLVGLLKIFKKKRFHILGFSKMMINPFVASVILLSGCIMYVIGSKFYENMDEKKIGKITSVLEAVLGAVVIAVVVYNIMHFNDGWGTDRGYTWRRSLEIYGELELKKKVFGVGLERLMYYYEPLKLYFHQPIYVSHSDPIQCLMTMGIVGMTGYIFFWITLFSRYFRKKLWKSQYAGFFLSLAAFFAQSLVNSCMVTNVAVFAMILSMYVITNEMNEGSQ